MLTTFVDLDGYRPTRIDNPDGVRFQRKQETMDFLNGLRSGVVDIIRDLQTTTYYGRDFFKYLARCLIDYTTNAEIRRRVGVKLSPQ